MRRSRMPKVSLHPKAKQRSATALAPPVPPTEAPTGIERQHLQRDAPVAPPHGQLGHGQRFGPITSVMQQKKKRRSVSKIVGDENESPQKRSKSAGAGSSSDAVMSCGDGRPATQRHAPMLTSRGAEVSLDRGPVSTADAAVAEPAGDVAMADDGGVEAAAALAPVVGASTWCGRPRREAAKRAVSSMQQPSSDDSEDTDEEGVEMRAVDVGAVGSADNGSGDGSTSEDESSELEDEDDDEFEDDDDDDFMESTRTEPKLKPKPKPKPPPKPKAAGKQPAAAAGGGSRPGGAASSSAPASASARSAAAPSMLPILVHVTAIGGPPSAPETAPVDATEEEEEAGEGVAAQLAEMLLGGLENPLRLSEALAKDKRGALLAVPSHRERVAASPRSLVVRGSGDALEATVKLAGDGPGLVELPMDVSFLHELIGQHRDEEALVPLLETSLFGAAIVVVGQTERGLSVVAVV